LQLSVSSKVVFCASFRRLARSVVTLFVTVCVLSLHHCAPEVMLPDGFGTQTACEEFIQAVLDSDEKMAKRDHLGFLFRCATDL
jgi:hypothetical protein